MASSSTTTTISSSAAIDPLVAKVLASKARRSSSSSSASSNDSSSLDALLSDPSDPISSAYRAQRLDQLSQLLAATRATVPDAVTTSTHERELMTTVAAAPRALVHFFRTPFARCGIMDEHLARLAAAHGETRFLRIDAEHAPFLCEKLLVRELPCVVGYVEGEKVERIVGFEGLGGDDFATGLLERRLVARGVLAVEVLGEGEGVEARKTREGRQRKKEQEADEDDWDD